MITYRHKFNASSVFLDEKYVGDIVQVEGGWAYKPKGRQPHGEVFATRDLVKKSIEEE